MRALPGRFAQRPALMACVLNGPLALPLEKREDLTFVPVGEVFSFRSSASACPAFLCGISERTIPLLSHVFVRSLSRQVFEQIGGELVTGVAWAGLAFEERLQLPECPGDRA